MSVAGKSRIVLLVGTRKGAFFIQEDASHQSWQLSDALFIGNIIHHVVMDPRDRETILLCAHTGHLGPTVFHSTDLGKTWQEASQPPSFPKAPEGEQGLVLDHNFWLTPGHAADRGVWYLGSSPPGLFRSEDGGRTWQGVAGYNEHPKWGPAQAGQEGPPDGSTLHSIMIDPRDARHMYICVSDGPVGGVFESVDKGASWHPINKGLQSDFMPVPDAETGHDPHCMRMHPANPDRLYQQNHCGVYRMDRSQGVWDRVGRNLPQENDISDYSFPIVLHPRDADTVWLMPLDGGFPLGRVTPNGKPAAYISRDGGKSWQRQDKGLPARNAWFSVKRQAMCADNREPVGLYFGTTGGEVWASRDEGEHWAQVAHSLPEIYSIEAAEVG